mmetsp:Transcript_2033/g.6037  ORF Transcript_2033/g.6037 Transcript_2033/m.6037 type:complete len:218 (+) Transcript_2033:193-846(+)
MRLHPWLRNLRHRRAGPFRRSTRGHRGARGPWGPSGPPSLRRRCLCGLGRVGRLVLAVGPLAPPAAALWSRLGLRHHEGILASQPPAWPALGQSAIRLEVPRGHRRGRRAAERAGEVLRNTRQHHAGGHLAKASGKGRAAERASAIRVQLPEEVRRLGKERPRGLERRAAARPRGGQRAAQPRLVDKGQEHDCLPLLVALLEVDLEVLWVEVTDRRG